MPTHVAIQLARCAKRALGPLLRIASRYLMASILGCSAQPETERTGILLTSEYAAVPGIEQIRVNATIGGTDLFGSATLAGPGGDLPPNSGSIAIFVSHDFAGSDATLRVEAEIDGTVVSRAEVTVRLEEFQLVPTGVELVPNHGPCALAVADSDGDGFIDCLDLCPDDGNKSKRGECGCGKSDIDSDGDLVPDCNDECPADPNKDSQGTCGCGDPDADEDEDGEPDCHIPATCAEWFERDEARATDGDYLIDPDGPGDILPFRVPCDMTNRGWTIIHTADFANGDSSGWVDRIGRPLPVDTSSSCFNTYGAMLGGFGNLGGAGGLATQIFHFLKIPHTTLSVSLDYYVLDDWQGEEAIVQVDGIDRYREALSAAALPSNTCGATSPDVGKQAVHFEVDSTSNIHAVSASSTLVRELTEASFGIDNIVIKIR